jgi:myo-inositol-1(or 4)-monophosphatase
LSDAALDDDGGERAENERAIRERPGGVAEADGAAADRGGRRPSGLEAELRFAIRTAEAAGLILMDHYERLERIDYKSARDVVTEADHLSEAFVLDAIRMRFPGDAILAEESGGHDGRDGSAPTDPRGRTWIIDPLDGTVNYANGIPVFCVSVALVVDGRPAAGVVHDPTRGDTYAATRDGPATLGGDPVRTSEKERLGDFVISLALGGRSVASRARAIRREVRISRSMGSAALALAYVANGRFDAFLQQGGLSAWDVAAAGLIAERAGATVTDFAGATWFDPTRDPRKLGLVAAPPAQHGTLLALANGVAVPPLEGAPRAGASSRRGAAPKPGAT